MYRHDDEIEKTKNFGKAAGYSEQATDYDLEDKIVVRWNVQKGERHGRHDLAKPENRRESFHGMKDANSAHRNDLNTSAYPDSGANGSSAHGPQQRLHHDGNSQMHRDRPQQRIHYDEAQQLVHHDSNPQMHYDNNPRLHSDRLQRQMEYEANSRIHYNGAQQQMHRDVNPTQHTPKSVVDNSSTQGFGAEAQETQRTFDFYNFKTKPTIYNMKSSAPAAAEGANENGGAQNPTQLENALETVQDTLYINVNVLRTRFVYCLCRYPALLMLLVGFWIEAGRSEKKNLKLSEKFAASIAIITGLITCIGEVVYGLQLPLSKSSQLLQTYYQSIHSSILVFLSTIVFLLSVLSLHNVSDDSGNYEYCTSNFECFSRNQRLAFCAVLTAAALLLFFIAVTSSCWAVITRNELKQVYRKRVHPQMSVRSGYY